MLNLVGIGLFLFLFVALLVVFGSFAALWQCKMGKVLMLALFAVCWSTPFVNEGSCILIPRSQEWKESYVEEAKALKAHHAQKQKDRRMRARQDTVGNDY